MKSGYIAISFALGLSGTPAIAFDDLSDSGRCTILSEWELGHTILITKLIDGTDDEIMNDDVVLMISNEEWSIKSGDKTDFVLKFESDDGSWLSNTPKSIDYGLMITTKINYLENFSNTDNIKIFKGKERIAVLDWGPFYREVQMFRLCVDKARAPILERHRLEKVREATPRDPFVKPTG